MSPYAQVHSCMRTGLLTRGGRSDRGIEAPKLDLCRINDAEDRDALPSLFLAPIFPARSAVVQDGRGRGIAAKGRLQNPTHS